VRRERRQVWEDRAAAVAQAIVPTLPRGLAMSLGRGAGRLLGALDRRHVAIADENLRHAFPDWDRERRLRTARGVYAHFGQMIAEHQPLLTRVVVGNYFDVHHEAVREGDARRIGGRRGRGRRRR